MDIQSIIFNKKYYTLYRAKMWLREHNKLYVVDEKINYYRFRQIDPLNFKKGSFRTRRITDGISLILGKLKLKR